MSRLIAITGLVMLSAAPALGQARQDVREASERCDGAGITDDRLWLECYYGAAQAMRSHLNLPPAPASQQRLVPGASAMAPPPARARAAAAPRAPAPLPQRSEGWFGPLLGGGKLVRANQRIESWTSTSVVLASGERWEVVHGGNGKMNWSGNPVVNIREGALGSYNMKVTGDSELYKVRPTNPR